MARRSSGEQTRGGARGVASLMGRTAQYLWPALLRLTWAGQVDPVINPNGVNPSADPLSHPDTTRERSVWATETAMEVVKG